MSRYNEDYHETAGIPNPKVETPIQMPKGYPPSLRSEIRDVIKENGLDDVRWEPFGESKDGVWTIRKGKPKFFAYVGQIVGTNEHGVEETHLFLPFAAGHDSFSADDPRHSHFETRDQAEAAICQQAEADAYAQRPEVIAADDAFEAEQEAARQRKAYIESMATGKHHRLQPGQAIDVRLGDTIALTDYATLAVTHPDGTTEALPSLWIKGRWGACSVVAFQGTYTYTYRVTYSVKLKGPMSYKYKRITFVVH